MHTAKLRDNELYSKVMYGAIEKKLF